MIDLLLTSHGLDKDEVSNFKSVLRQATFEKGSHFIVNGQMCPYLAIVETGYLRVYHPDGKGNEITTEFFRPGIFCSSYFGFYSRTAAYESIQCITDCELHLISLTALEGLYAESFQINSFGRRVLEKVCMDKDFVLKRVIHLSATEKYKWFLKAYPDVAAVAKLGHVASFLGMKQETLSRVRRRPG